ncbi:prepilin-type N-terminal cleavage/methylation domain-containing protein [Desulfosporosinus sp. OT]|uniref:prepilin-type N-terminal cleavage/methylation domain-containing protein n=1 Tax=Desulfosporosinus sp. OT TaxID=913865 RepID=UPI000223AD43|nr:prepilin-type N-terminal cleavage/methylation domain-containing protein [Desulfosporosinus sp. OT]EGW40341.1 prepilin-type N-terminal cleavage/methylation domain protein [Desulfosporosinus sp. OT]
MHNDKGFTLVEVVVAVAIVAIVSTALFQMFVTSSYVNADAQLMDMANTVAVKQVESFKANPDAYDPSAKYYNRSGNECSRTDSAIMIESKMDTDLNDNNNAAYGYPDFVNSAGSFTLTTDIDVTITQSYEVYVGTLKLCDYATSKSKVVNNTLPIRVDFPAEESPHTINLTNESDVMASFYIFDANVSNANFENVNTNVIINALQGAYSISFVPATSSSSSNNGYVLTLTVSRINKGVSEEMFKYSTKKYH